MAKDETTWFDGIFESLKHAPAWVGPVTAAVGFTLFRYIAPLFIPLAKPGVFEPASLLRPLMPMFAWLISGGILLAWVAAEWHKWRNRRLLDTRSGTASLADISWREFEYLVSEAYRRQGYMAVVVGSAGGDGGVDIELTRPGELVLVQCKQWKAYAVGVTTIREMLGVVVSRRAQGGIVVTSGKFTAEARRFAQQSHPTIQLVDGHALFQLVRSVQPQPATLGAERSASQRPAVSRNETAPACPICGEPMVERTARHGPSPGSRFWGCPKYPRCRGTREIAGWSGM